MISEQANYCHLLFWIAFKHFTLSFHLSVAPIELQWRYFVCVCFLCSSLFQIIKLKQERKKDANYVNEAACKSCFQDLSFHYFRYDEMRGMKRESASERARKKDAWNKECARGCNYMLDKDRQSRREIAN